VPGDRQGNKGALSKGKGGVPPVPLHAGVSFGGAVLLDLANVAPEAIRGAALIVPGGLIPGEWVEGWFPTAPPTGGDMAGSCLPCGGCFGCLDLCRLLC
jgi:pimeloyl-ACP methyl ester carboxylesterase